MDSRPQRGPTIAANRHGTPSDFLTGLPTGSDFAASRKLTMSANEASIGAINVVIGVKLSKDAMGGNGAKMRGHEIDTREAESIRTEQITQLNQ